MGEQQVSQDEAQTRSEVADALDRIGQHPQPFGPDVRPTERERALMRGAAVGLRAQQQ